MRSNNATPLNPNGPAWLSVSGPMTFAEINCGPLGCRVSTLSGCVVLNDPFPAVSTAICRLFGCEGSITSRIGCPEVTVTPEIVACEKAPEPFGNVTPISTLPDPVGVSNNRYGGAFGAAIYPSKGEVPGVPSGNNTPPGIAPPGVVLVNAFPFVSVIDKLTGAALDPFPTTNATKSAPDASTVEIARSYGSGPPSCAIGAAKFSPSTVARFCPALLCRSS